MNFHVVDGPEYVANIAESVEMEHDRCAAAKLHHSNLCKIFVDGKRAGDPLGKGKDALVPIVVVTDDNACRLVKHQHYVSRPRTCYVAYCHRQQQPQVAIVTYNGRIEMAPSDE